MRASSHGRSSLGAAGLSASTPLASPSDAPIAIPTHSIQALRDLVIIEPQHTCGGDAPPAAEPWAALESRRARGCGSAMTKKTQRLAEHGDRCFPRARSWVRFQPGPGVHGFAPLANFKIQLRGGA